MLKIVMPLTIILFNSKKLNNMFIMMLMLILMKNFYHPIELKIYFSELMMTDAMSSPLIILTLWITFLMILAGNFTSSNKLQTFLNINIIMLCLILIFSFLVTNMMSFYIMFEASLLPTLMIILGWGYQPERLQASMYLMMYTITASLPFLIAIMYFLNKKNTLNIFLLFNTDLFSYYFMLMFLMAFLVKMPMYITHLWLPKAHVEAPVAGSMILAGVLLKLGGYGIIRMMMMMKNLMFFSQNFFIVVSMWGAFATSMICIRQQDMKSLIAYSSVGHMALLIAGLMSSTKWGLNGATTMMIAHGLASPALFALANMSYEINKTRSMLLSKGVLFLIPIMSMWWFLMSIANMAAPPTLNLAGEIMLMIGILYNNMSMAIMFALASFLAAAYSLLLYTSTNHGKPMFFFFIMVNSLSRNSLLIIYHFIPLYLMILFPNLMMLMS